jgi:hypothetical protein
VIPRLTPSRLRHMSHEWLDVADNPAMTEWELKAEDIYAGVTVIELALAVFRVALSADSEAYAPVLARGELDGIRRLDEPDGRLTDRAVSWGRPAGCPSRRCVPAAIAGMRGRADRCSSSVARSCRCRAPLRRQTDERDPEGRPD